MAAAVGGTGSGSVLAIDKSQKNEFESFVNFIRLYHEQQIFNILQQDDDTAHYSLCIDLNDLIKHDVALAYSLLESPSRYLPLMDLATQELQRQTIATHLMRECISEKPNVHVRITR
ncbi:hypothetical protein EV182_007398 [Spiromyces aspiralis]|uniref:Uncharacterized protein n=1 Tax=Spiromyces aspiralis TaxID=68401 RepID=A0ACC1H7M8_9FUNG|nr:hypothetical protein EV182_007398 [Spiromyces aspiralis]